MRSIIVDDVGGKSPSHRPLTCNAIFMLMAPFIGLLISLYLIRVSSRPAEELLCDVSAFFSCSTILHSSFAKIFGVSVALLGALYNVCFLGLVLEYELRGRPPVLIPSLAFFAFSGLGAVLYFIVAEAIIGKICLLCTSVHVCALCSAYTVHREATSIHLTLASALVRFRSQLFNRPNAGSKWLAILCLLCFSSFVITQFPLFNLNSIARPSSSNADGSLQFEPLRPRMHDYQATLRVNTERGEASIDEGDGFSMGLDFDPHKQERRRVKQLLLDPDALVELCLYNEQSRIYMFGSPSCGACKRQKSWINNRLPEELFVSCDEHPPVCEAYNVTIMPTWIQFLPRLSSLDPAATLESLGTVYGEPLLAARYLNYDRKERFLRAQTPRLPRAQPHTADEWQKMLIQSQIDFQNRVRQQQFDDREIEEGAPPFHPKQELRRFEGLLRRNELLAFAGCPLLQQSQLLVM